MARKGKYEEWLTEEGLLRIEAWCRDGLTKAQIAHNMGISMSTLCEWQNRFSEFSEALKKGREVADILVENAMFKRAVGYEYEEVTTEIRKVPYKKKDGTWGERDQKHVKKTTKMVIPDTTAQIFWLKNRKPDIWRDRQDQVIHSIEDLTPLAELLK